MGTKIWSGDNFFMQFFLLIVVIFADFCWFWAVFCWFLLDFLIFWLWSLNPSTITLIVIEVFFDRLFRILFDYSQYWLIEDGLIVVWTTWSKKKQLIDERFGDWAHIFLNRSTNYFFVWTSWAQSKFFSFDVRNVQQC